MMAVVLMVCLAMRFRYLWPEPQTVAERPLNLQQWMGKQGTATCAMLPSGEIRIGDTVLSAVSNGVPIEAGAGVEVQAIRGNYVVVRPLDLASDSEETK